MAVIDDAHIERKGRETLMFDGNVNGTCFIDIYLTGTNKYSFQMLEEKKTCCLSFFPFHTVHLLSVFSSFPLLRRGRRLDQVVQVVIKVYEDLRRRHTPEDQDVHQPSARGQRNQLRDGEWPPREY